MVRASLQLRLFLVAAFAIVAALTAVALMSRQVAHTEFRRITLNDVDQDRLSVHEARMRTAAQIARRLGETDPARFNAVLGEMADTENRELVLLGTSGRVIGASTAALRRANVRLGPYDFVEIEYQHGVLGVVISRSRSMLHNPPRAEVRRPDGRVIGRLLSLPRDGDELELPARAAFGMAFDRRLLIAAVAAGLIALALTWLVSRRILEPVAALTHAAARLGRGDWSPRVAVKGHDELADLSRAFNAMAESLGHQEALRRTLVTDVAHELRTPLTNLRCQIEAIEDGLLAPTPETVHSLREEVLHLSHLVEDLQTLSVAEAGRLALDRAPVGVRDLVEGAVERFAAQAAGRNVALRTEVPELPAVLADPARIGQVLGNLLANALTHTPEGGTIVIGAGEKDGAVVISVADSGPGIDPEHLPHVFERFYRADPSRARATGGAGLGLAIVKGIVEAHGGRVEAESPPGSGAVLQFSLPRS